MFYWLNLWIKIWLPPPEKKGEVIYVDFKKKERYDPNTRDTKKGKKKRS